MHPEMETGGPRRVLIIYTGGTIGMKHTSKGYAPVSGWMETRLSAIYPFQDPKGPPRTTPVSKYGRRICYDILEYENLLDSANMEVRHWIQIARDIERHYEDYDGFVILHGTDTMAYTASALSFMLVNLRKTVVLTGSQIPLSEIRNDAVNNLLEALTIAGHFEIPEVCLYFDNMLFRGNRSRKIDASGLGAFQSGNFPPLAQVQVRIEVSWHLVRAAPARSLKLRVIEEQNVASLRLFPGITVETLRNFLKPPLRGLVLETYGSGNVPSTRQDLLDVLQKASERGIIIVNCTQCFQGGVTGDYAAGSVLGDIGVCSAKDMTPEAALTKLAFLLSQPDLDADDVKENMGRNLRGELTDSRDARRFSFQEQTFVDSVAKVLAQGDVLGIQEDISRTMFPVLMCSAASRGDVEAMERMLASNADVDIGDYDGRTPLHLAAAEGRTDAIRFLLEEGATVNSVDRWGGTPLHDARRHGQHQAAALLEQNGARTMASDSAAALCAAAAEGKTAELVRLVENGADVSQSDPDRRTPLHLAAAGGHLDAVLFLLRRGASRRARDRWGGLPLDDARRNGDAELIEALDKEE